MADHKELEIVCREGICPLCGEKYEYNGAKDSCDNGFTIPWECPYCGATGEEGYTEYFDGMHYNVRGADGCHYSFSAPAQVPAPRLIFSQLLEALPKASEDPEKGLSNLYWTNDEKILCRTKEMCTAVADFLDALGQDVTIGYYDPVDDRLDGCEDEMAGWYYIK